MNTSQSSVFFFFFTVPTAGRWWTDRESIMQIAKDKENMVSTNHQQYCGKQKKFLSKAADGRGPKRAEWVQWLYGELLDEFDRLRKAGVKFSPKLLCTLAINIIESSSHPTFHPHYEVNDRTIVDHINYRWITRFMATKNIVCRSQTGKLMVSPETTLHIEKQVAYHIGVVSREYSNRATPHRGLLLILLRRVPIWSTR
jgi:hypothetical protein